MGEGGIPPSKSRLHSAGVLRHRRRCEVDVRVNATIIDQAAQIAALEARVARLEALLQQQAVTGQANSNWMMETFVMRGEQSGSIFDFFR